MQEVQKPDGDMCYRLGQQLGQQHGVQGAKTAISRAVYMVQGHSNRAERR
jgi:hypothetical protein